METRRLQMLVELARRGSMRAVADELGVTTSTVSQQIAALAHESGTALVEPAGRQVRLTPAGRRLAEHAVTILAAVEAARLDLDPDAEPAGTVRIAGFATAIRTLLPIIRDLATTHPAVRLLFFEHEPSEALELLADAAADVALVYDYNLAPRTFDSSVSAKRLWATRWSLGVPDPPQGSGAADVDALQHFAAHRESDWIVNSRNTADEDVVRTVASMAGFAPRITHRADSLDLVQDLIVAGLGVGLLPSGVPPRPGVRLLGLSRPDVALRSYAVTTRGRRTWSPLALLLGRLAPGPARG
ncbi:LysR family transcriptional regulator [Pseudonocardia sp.]|uniref:LysR family transcriptional regulator n=1 Tax=Pseudonocardia sp. TaxID=60912 RepID=UPI00262D8137|nr:LysR family transcriptional regulator [Pseudonocardia sp.]MCW2718499.1 LysR family transcriptional regulator [Pseudonocardia sp.]